MAVGLFVAAALIPIAVKAANDWSHPCFGECNWDINSGSGSGTVRLVGSHSGLSDLTAAAGWQILDCDPATADQDIRLVCYDSEKGCDHLSQNGAEGTLVRLPNNCGSMPFAIVARHWVHDNQTIPASTRSLIKRGTDATVKGISLTTNFTAVDPTVNGNIRFFLQGSSIPGVAGNFTVAPPINSTALTKRGLSAWGRNTLFSIGNFDKQLSGQSPLNFEADVPLFDQSFSCSQDGKTPAFSGEAKADVKGKVDGTISYGVAAAGSLIPPHMKEFGLFVGLDAALTGTLELDTTLTGVITSVKIPLYETGLHGLDYPGILSIDPTFSVNAEATALLDANLNLDVDLAYTISGAKLYFPPSSNPSGGFTPGDSNLKLSVSPNVTSHSQIAAHLIPTLAFGVNVLSGVAKATVSLDIDASAGLDLSLAAVPRPTAATNDSTAEAVFSGCVDVTTGLDVQVGADGSLLGFFDASTSLSLFKKTFDLFKKCFGSGPVRRAHIDHSGKADLLVKRQTVGCPTSALPAAMSIAEEAISGLSLF